MVNHPASCRYQKMHSQPSKNQSNCNATDMFENTEIRPLIPSALWVGDPASLWMSKADSTVRTGFYLLHLPPVVRNDDGVQLGYK